MLKIFIIFKYVNHLKKILLVSFKASSLTLSINIIINVSYTTQTQPQNVKNSKQKLRYKTEKILEILSEKRMFRRTKIRLNEIAQQKRKR